MLNAMEMNCNQFAIFKKKWIKINWKKIWTENEWLNANKNLYIIFKKKEERKKNKYIKMKKKSYS
jgi:hypothetical protein